ncbi:MAG: hypothetical protein U9R42_03685 [Bacteroidota bacterium]|nr:hypothetical protein [Bacteroidota bacterium]
MGCLKLDISEQSGSSFSMELDRKRALEHKQSEHLGNVLSTVTDRKLPIDLSANQQVDYFNADIAGANDYYPFGMLQVNRSYSLSQYRFGFGGQEQDNEISGIGNIYTAEFWQYDSRIARRWNTDPEPKAWESPYVAFANNPIWFTDPNGRDTIVNPNGEKMNVGDGYTTSNDKTVLYGEGLQTKIWDKTALGISGEYNGNYVNYDSEKHGKINNANSATATIENALNNVERSISQGGLLQDLKNDLGFKAFEFDVVQQALKDSRFGNSAFAFDYNNGQGSLITFGGESSTYLPMSVQAGVTAVSPLLSLIMFQNTWSAAFTNTTWVVRHTYVKARVEVTANGVMGVTFSFEDVLDLKEGEQGDTYNFVVRQLGKVWTGNQEMKVNGAWHNKYQKK